jgi:hypothetical protein
MIIKWREITRNCHSGSLNDITVVTVERSQKNRRDGTKHDWHIVTLHDHSSWNSVVVLHDPRDLESTKRAAEQRVIAAIGLLYRFLFEDFAI